MIMKTKCYAWCAASFIDLFAVAVGVTFEGAIRTCSIHDKDECKDYKDETIPGFNYSHVTGRACACKEDLCNSAPQIPVGRMALTFTVVSLLALVAGRSLSQ